MEDDGGYRFVGVVRTAMLPGAVHGGRIDDEHAPGGAPARRARAPDLFNDRFQLRQRGHARRVQHDDVVGDVELGVGMGEEPRPDAPETVAQGGVVARGGVHLGGEQGQVAWPVQDHGAGDVTVAEIEEDGIRQAECPHGQYSC